MSRYLKGKEQFDKITDGKGEEMMDIIRKVSPEFERFIMEYPFGDLYSRNELDLKTRELITIASLTTLGHALPQLKLHIKAALNCGCTKTEITETILQLTAYAGFPACINAIIVAKEVFEETDDVKE